MSTASTRPTILDVADLAARSPGMDPPLPQWRSTLAYLYGLPLGDQQIADVAAASFRSPEAIRDHARRVLGRRRFREFWARLGRRSRKSATAALIAVYEAAYGDHGKHLMPGEIGLVAVVSKDLAGAAVVTRFVRLYAEAIGLRVTSTRMGAVALLEIEGCQLAIASFPATASAPRGWPIAVLILDELAHAFTGDDYENSDAAIVGAATPAMAQFSSPLVVGISTPLGLDGVFHERVEASLGNDADEQALSVTGATWEWSAITEARCRELEKDEEVFAREFAARPCSTEGLAFVPTDVEAAFKPRADLHLYRFSRPVIALDPASRSNTTALLVAWWGAPVTERIPKRLQPPPGSGLGPGIFVGVERDARGEIVYEQLPTRPVLRIERITGWAGEQLRTMGQDRVISEIAAIAKNVGANTVLSDAHAESYIAALLAPHGLTLRSFFATADSKHEAACWLRSIMRDSILSIEAPERSKAAAQMKRDLLGFPRRAVGGSSGGGFRYGADAKRGHHHDFGSALLVLAHAETMRPTSDEWSRRDPRREDFAIDGSPTRHRQPNVRTEIGA